MLGIQLTEKQRNILIGLAGSNVALAILFKEPDGTTAVCGSVLAWMLTERMRYRISDAVALRQQLRAELLQQHDKSLVDDIMRVGGWEN